MPRPTNLGIDLGTTCCRAAFLDDQQLVSVPLVGSLYACVPVIQFHRRVHPPRVAFPSLKQRLEESFPLGAGRPAASGLDILVRLLLDIRQRASHFAGTEFSRTVISCSAAMTPADRAIIGAAAAQAGFARVRLLSDVVAAAHAFRFHERKDQPLTLLLYSEGYMGADAAVMRSSRHGVHEIASDSDVTQLGGGVLDETLVAGFLDELLRGQPPSEREPLLSWMQRLLQIVRDGKVTDDAGLETWLVLRRVMERAKEAIGDEPRHRFSLPPACLPPGVQWLEVELDGIAFGGLLRQHNRAAAALIDRVLQSNDLSDGDLNRVLLVGGTTYQPTLLRAFAQRFSAERVLSQSLLAVAEGSALVATELTDADVPVSGVRSGRIAPDVEAHPYRPPLDLFRIVERRACESTPQPVDELPLRVLRAWLVQGRQREALEALEQLRSEATRLIESHARPRSS